MPLYRLQCAARCGHEEDIFRAVADRDRDLPTHCDAPMVRKIVAPMVAPDIDSYRAIAVDVATGEVPVINSRSAHREFLKRNGYIEIGNETGGRNPGPDNVRGDFDVRGDLARATSDVLRSTR
ncbi:zinc ribbon domain-containing protein [Paraburkholderia caballeronis]|uniref:Putative regulatory protein FmdB zinc ribbon domain-containing protein n=1 Tax=Paraburkholderia caballeronis TaxID=416943 RepID=A0A1H7L226_9BURK|nr:zinc ribbon domain-containing protein [Paraburkholderia caballeronis]PXW28250.1 hypothetical protein C7403_102142 [Paraburkholderia caballeronis]PXX03616.1 hypothetical protein C7407_102142 [Paraburkholderia caballeronis]RAK04360.1 hypothetical protein C7409_102142 [Paraburkholderia caballeronis]SED83293.1 hypothetical protein SAMN05445871_4037 [Paraburkholderia caballeronis]SEK92736.1 hypothetical protein SAMN05192542_104142 [Paraburkholderia caballeronis]